MYEVVFRQFSNGFNMVCRWYWWEASVLALVYFSYALYLWVNAVVQDLENFLGELMFVCAGQCVRLWVVAKAPHSNPAGFVLPEKDNQLLLWILKYPRKSSLSLGQRLNWRIWSEMMLKKSELFGQLRDQYMTKMNFLWCGRDILKRDNGKLFVE